MKSINREEFFKLISIHSGGVDLDTVRDVYYGMVRTIGRELKEKQTVDLPDWGEFNLKIIKARRALDVNDRIVKDLPAKTVVKFKPATKVKKHFYSLGTERTVL